MDMSRVAIDRYFKALMVRKAAERVAYLLLS